MRTPARSERYDAGILSVWWAAWHSVGVLFFSLGRGSLQNIQPCVFIFIRLSLCTSLLCCVGTFEVCRLVFRCSFWAPDRTSPNGFMRLHAYGRPGRRVGLRPVDMPCNCCAYSVESVRGPGFVARSCLLLSWSNCMGQMAVSRESCDSGVSMAALKPGCGLRSRW